jgi:hypothetical protein
MSVAKVEAELARIKEDFSEISAVRTSKTKPVQKQKRSRPVIIWAGVAVIIIALLVLVIVLLSS